MPRLDALFYRAGSQTQLMPDEPADIRESDNRDPLHRMRAHRLACELLREAWEDAEKLTHHRTMERVSAHLYAAVGPIDANRGEGYAHRSGKDRLQICEYPLG